MLTQSVSSSFLSTLPVKAEAEDVFVEFVFGGAVVNSKADVNEFGADLGFGPSGRMCVTALNERDSMALRVDCSEPLTFVIETKNFACLNA